MAENSKIEWTDHTFNPWTGCMKVSPGCDHCYAESWAKRSGTVQWGDAPRRRTTTANWRQPLKWNAQAELEGRRYRVFCASPADVFDNTVPAEWRADLFDLITETPALDWLLLTKRVGNVGNMLPVPFDFARLYPTVRIGATMINQEEWDRDIDKLLALDIPNFVSLEPLLGGIDMRSRRPDWVIVGGESGPHARPMHPAWVRSLRDQCDKAGIQFLFKQHGEWLATEFCDDAMAMLPSRRTVYVNKFSGEFHDGSQGIDFFSGDEETAWVGKKSAGRILDGRTHDGFPEAR